MKAWRHYLFGRTFTKADQLERQIAFDVEMEPVKGDLLNAVAAIESGTRVMSTMAGMINIMATNQKVGGR